MLLSAKPKKGRESAKKEEREKSESAECERKKARICSFSSPPSGKVSESKAAGRGKARVLSKMYSSVVMLKIQRGKDTWEETQGRDVGEETEG
jgi:hypothetical protein